MNKLIPFIWAAGVVHLLITSVNFFLPAKLRYAENLSKVSTIIQQIFVVHSIYIVLVLLGLSGLCFAFAPELAGATSLGRALSGFIAVFWSVRVPIQLFYYDPALKRENLAVHILFTTAFIYLAVLFIVAVLGVVR